MHTLRLIVPWQQLDEIYVEKIVNHVETGSNPKKWEYRTRWLGYEPEDDS